MSSGDLSTLVTFNDFSRVTDPNVYSSMPADWWVGVTDVVGSTQAIEAGRYKAVNMAGAAAISAAMNALDHEYFPFAFGGDGSQLAVPLQHKETIRDVLALTARWSQDTLGLTLRTSLVPVCDILSAGYEVLMAHYAPSDAVHYAMFAGGGMEWAEEQLKANRYAVSPAPAGERPDLSGLSCRWKPMEARSGVMLSVIIRRNAGAKGKDFTAAIEAFLEMLASGEEAVSPVPEQGPSFGSPLAGFDLEAKVEYGAQGSVLDRLRLFAWRMFAWVIVQTGMEVGGFRADQYRRQSALNSDFRKFHDGLHMTIDCTPEKTDAIECWLLEKEKQNAIRFGIFRQAGALMTCIVPSYSADNHFHFIDGAGGGYAQAARRLKALAAEEKSQK